MYDSEKAKGLVSQLKELAADEGCSLEEFVAKVNGGGEEEEEGEEMGEEKGQKLSLIVARMKAKNKPAEEDYEG